MPNADARVAVPAGERQYHIGLGPGEVADYILLPGDQDRVDRIAAHFDSVERRHRHREFASATGEYKGLRVTALSTGIGTDNVEIVIAEILAIADKPTFIRIGSCGALQEGMELGDLVISTGSVRLETTTNWFVHEALSGARPLRGDPRPRGGREPSRASAAPRESPPPRPGSTVRRDGPSPSFRSDTLTSPRR